MGNNECDKLSQLPQLSKLSKLSELPIETVPVVLQIRPGSMPEFTTRVMRSSIDVAERARNKEWLEADEDERADILMGDAISEIFW